MRPRDSSKKPTNSQLKMVGNLFAAPLSRVRHFRVCTARSSGVGLEPRPLTEAVLRLSLRLTASRLLSLKL